MKNKKALISAIIIVAALIVGFSAAIIVKNVFMKAEKEPVTVPATSTVQEVTVPTAANGRPKTARPTSVVAAVYGTEESQPLEQFSANGFNTVIFELDGNNTENVKANIAKAHELGLYHGVRADASADDAYLLDFIKENNFDFVILKNSESTGQETCGKIIETDPAIQIGIEPSYNSSATETVMNYFSSGKADFVFLFQNANDETGIKMFRAGQSAWNEEAYPIWLCHNLESLSDFTNEQASEMISLISRSADMPLAGALAFYPYSEIATATGNPAKMVLGYIQTRDTYLLDKEFSITNYDKTSITVDKPTITFNGTSSPLSELFCNGQKVTTATTGDFSIDCELKAGENKIKFEHKEKTYEYKVTYKVKLLKSVSPAENVTVPGGMQIEVSAVALRSATLKAAFNGKSYNMTATGSADSADDNSPDADADFVTFTATLTVPEGKSTDQKLGAITVNASYNSLSESLKGGSVTVAAVEPEPTLPPATEPPTTTATEAQTETPTAPEASDVSTDVQGSDAETSETPATSETEAVPPETVYNGETLQRYKHTSNYGLGSATICEIIDDYVEVFPSNTTATYSVPDCSPLLKGTVDYVKGSPITLDGDTYYVLASGVKVPKGRTERLASGENGTITHVKISSGYVMPKNNIKVVSTKCTADATVVTLDMNRTVAFNAKLLGQTYGSYNGRLVTVSSLNCTALEFTFSDTATGAGAIELSNSVCKNAKWDSDTSKSTVTLTFNLASPGKFYGYHYEYDSNGMLIISIKHKPGNSLSGYTIMLDPGHGGIDSGAVGAVKSTDYGLEKQINLSLASKIKNLLEDEGATVIMTRTTDKWVCYADRNAAVRDRNPDIFISIHCDSSTSSSATGTSAYYYRAYSQPLAKAINQKLAAVWGDKIYAGNSGIKTNRGSNFYAFRVTRVEECPAILIEYGFVSNTTECQKLQDAKNRDMLAQATVDGIKSYIASV